MTPVVVFSCTNRPDSNTVKVSRIYAEILESRGIPVKFMDFTALPRDIAFSELSGKNTPEFEAIVREYVSPHHKFIFVVPEYNGSFPGILKVFLDHVHPREWHDKDACLVGISDGRAGNLRGLEHLTGILNYLKVHVYHDKLPISVINSVMDETGRFVSVAQEEACVRQVEGFLKF